MLLPLPAVPDEQRATAQGLLRYEDVSQDGLVLLGALPHLMSLAVFRGLFAGHAFARAIARAGIVPIVTRIVITGGGGPVSVRKPVDVEGGYQLGHTVDESGTVNRLLLNTFAVLTAPAGRTHPPAPPNAGESIEVGRVLIEHVYTRPFAPRAERKVLRFDVGPGPAVPPTRLEWRPHGALLAPPEGGTPLDAALAPDESSVVFGLTHTDSNQHVNSLAYPRLFEEAVLRRVASHGLPATLLARSVEVAYRKPCFAGQRARVFLALHRSGEGLCAFGVFVAEGETIDRPNAAVRMELR